MAKISMTLLGDEEFIKMLRKAGRGAAAELAKPLHVEAERIMTESKRRTPVDTGTLRASGVVRRPDITRHKVSIELGYGGAARAYALAVHEHPSRHSPPSWGQGVSFTVGGPKYLEGPVKEAEKGFGKRIARHLDLFKKI